MSGLRPFWRYYGGKWRAAPRYPAPRHRTIVEPFAGAAGYSLRYFTHRVVLVERYAVVAEIWRYLIRVKPAEVLRIPEVEHVDELPSWVSESARALVGFCLNNATTHPCRQLSAGRKKLAAMGRRFEGWSEAQRARVARQVTKIRHWRVIESDYSSSPDVVATWFVDPPYSNGKGSYYEHAETISYAPLAAWCWTRRGQVIVCENEGASWLPFETFATLKAGVNGQGSREVVYLAEQGTARR